MGATQWTPHFAMEAWEERYVHVCVCVRWYINHLGTSSVDVYVSHLLEKHYLLT